jgi:hypothetical protein
MQLALDAEEEALMEEQGSVVQVMLSAQRKAAELVAAPLGPLSCWCLLDIQDRWPAAISPLPGKGRFCRVVSQRDIVSEWFLLLRGEQVFGAYWPFRSRMSWRTRRQIMAKQGNDQGNLQLVVFVAVTNVGRCFCWTLDLVVKGSSPWRSTKYVNKDRRLRESRQGGFCVSGNTDAERRQSSSPLNTTNHSGSVEAERIAILSGRLFDDGE